MRGCIERGVVAVCVCAVTAMVGAVFLDVGFASALTYSSEINPGFTIQPAITISLSSSDLTIDNLNPGTTGDSNIITITTSSNALGGYTLSGTVGASATNYTDLRLTSSDTTNKFTSLSTNKATLANFDDNYWGYSYSTDNGTTWVSGDAGSTSAGYNGLPLYSATGVKLVDTATIGTNSIKFKIGAKSGAAQLAGTYTNTVNFTMVAEATPEPEPKIYMQDLTLTNCAVNVGQGSNPTGVGDELTVYDKRTSNYASGDDASYTVRYINGECWMTQNLRITGTISATDSNFSGSDFNVSQYDLKTNGASGGVCDSTNGYSYACSRTPDSTDLSTIGGDATAKSVGAWYNFAAASAGTITTNSNTDAVTSDICPSGWHLPTGPNTTADTDFNKLIGNTTGDWQDTTGLAAFGAVPGGSFYGGSLRGTGIGTWWSATSSYATLRHSLDYNSSNGQFYGNNSDYRYYGLFVRCLRSS